MIQKSDIYTIIKNNTFCKADEKGVLYRLNERFPKTKFKLNISDNPTYTYQKLSDYIKCNEGDNIQRILKHFRHWNDKFPKITDTKVNFYHSKNSYAILLSVIVYGTPTTEIEEWVESFFQSCRIFTFNPTNPLICIYYEDEFNKSAFNIHELHKLELY